LGRLLSAWAIKSLSSVTVGQYAAKISYVRRPSKNALAVGNSWLLWRPWSAMNLPVQPPYANPPSRSSPACPGAWITPSSDTYSTTIKLLTRPPLPLTASPPGQLISAPCSSPPGRLPAASGPKLSAPTAARPGRSPAVNPAVSATYALARRHGIRRRRPLTVIGWYELPTRTVTGPLRQRLPQRASRSPHPRGACGSPGAARPAPAGLRRSARRRCAFRPHARPG